MNKNQRVPGVQYRETQVAQVLYRHDFIDNWFPVRYSLNPYSGCEYGCYYCQVNWKSKRSSNNPKSVITKVNSLEILSQELRQLAQPQIIGVGGGYNDIFAPVNRNKKLSDKIILELLKRGHRPLIMTKNPSYVLEIVGDWLDFPESQRPIIITSISGSVGSDSFRLEPGTPSITDRISAINKLSSTNKVGVAFLPWLDHSTKELAGMMKLGKASGWNFTLLGSLKGSLGDKKIFPPKKNCHSLESDYLNFSKEIRLWPRLPSDEFFSYLIPKDVLTVLLAYRYYLGDKQKKNTFRLASLGINRLTETEFQKLFLSDQLEKITGVGPVISQMIRNFLRYKTIDYFTNIWEGTYD